MRILKFLSVYLAFAALIFIIVIGWNWKEFTTVFDNSDALTDGQEFVEQTFSVGGMADFIRGHPEYVSVYSISLRSDSAQLSIEAEKPRTLGILSGSLLALHTVYAQQSGEINLKTAVSIDSVNLYQLPNHYRTAHEKSLDWLTENGRINDGTVQLASLVEVLVQYNSLAIHDYLLQRFGIQSIWQTLATFGLKDTVYLAPFSGYAIQLHPKILGGTFDQRFDSLMQLSENDRANAVYMSARAYIYNANFRDKVTNAFQEFESGISFMQEKQAFAAYPQLSAKDLSSIFQQAISTEILNKESKQRLLGWMSWPMGDRTFTHLFHIYGGVFENRMSLAGGLDIAYSKERADTVIQTVLFDRIPIALWFHMSSKYIHQDYQRRLVWDAELRERSLKAPKRGE